MESLRKRVFKLISNDPNLPIKTLLKQFKNESEVSVRTYRNQCLNDIYINRKKSISDISEVKDLPEKENNNRSVLSNSQSKRGTSDFIIDKDLEHFEGIELIKHFTEKAIKNKLLNMSDRIRVMSIYVQFYDKAGKIRDLGLKDDKEMMIELRKIPINDRLDMLKPSVSRNLSPSLVKNIEKANKETPLAEWLETPKSPTIRDIKDKMLGISNE